MTARRWVSSAPLAVLLLVAGCGHDESPRAQASPSATPTLVTSDAPTPEADAAAAATSVVTEMLRVTDAAKKNPGIRDWEPEIRRFAGDPAAFLAAKSVRDYAALGLRQEGDTVVDLQVTSVDLSAPQGPMVRITGCYDSDSTRVMKVESGQVVPPGTPQRYVWDITVTRYQAEPGSPWLVNVLEPLTDRPC